MNLQEAIKIGEDLGTTLPQSNPEERRQAVKLLIEAGKAILLYRHYSAHGHLTRLPGETRE